MGNTIPPWCPSVIGFGLLVLFAVDTAIAQHEGTSEEDLRSKGVMNVPTSKKPLAENTRGVLDGWVPPDIDAMQLPDLKAASCSLPDVVSKAGVRVEELVHNLDRFSATEVIQHQPVNRSGKLQHPEIQKFNYVYSMKEAPDGYMISEENRDLTKSSNGFPDQVATIGSPGLILIFHPNYVKDFRMSCEGLGDWHGQPAWQVRFEELPDCVHRMSDIIINGKSYDMRIRGIAWILGDSYQVAHLEIDLADMIPKIRLRLDHQAIDYLPVSFPQSDTTIWLPSSAELYMDFRGHRFYRRHTYTNFKLFSVKVQQEFGTYR
jgi:hypothetical protein